MVTCLYFSWYPTYMYVSWILFLFTYYEILSSYCKLQENSWSPKICTKQLTEACTFELIYFFHCRKAFARSTLWFLYTPAMSIFNISEGEISAFFLIGIPGMEHVHIWVSVPICLIHLVAILGSCTIFLIKTETSLHEPMYYFPLPCWPSDLGLSVSSPPTMLRIFLFNATGTSLMPVLPKSFSFIDSQLWSHQFFLLCPYRSPYGHPQPSKIFLTPDQCQSH